MTTQVGTDILRTDLNEDWRLIGGVFFGNVYGRAHTNSLLTARSKVVGFGGGAYLTLFNGNSPDDGFYTCLLYTSPRPRDGLLSRMPSSA